MRTGGCAHQNDRISPASRQRVGLRWEAVRTEACDYRRQWAACSRRSAANATGPVRLSAQSAVTRRACRHLTRKSRDEVDCYEVPPALGEPRREHFVLSGAMPVFHWQHPDGDVEIHDVNLPEVDPPPEP